MKNKLIIASMALLGTAGLTSCVADTEPRLDKPTEFVLNMPALGNQLYVFDADASGNSINDITFTVSQPNYGVAATPVYSVQVARSEADFAKWDEEQKLPADPDTPDAPEGDGTHAEGDYTGLPLTAMVDQTTTNAVITLDGEKFCNAVNAVYGLTMENVKDQPHPVAVRVYAEVKNAPYSGIWSNPITIKVRSYIKPVPDKIYIIGACQGWDISKDAMYLEETEIGNRIYVGDYTIPAGQFMFRFYDELGSWDHFSIGSQVDDKPVDITVNGEAITELPEDGITLPCLQEVNGVNPKGSWNIPDWKGGKVHIEVNLNTNEVTFAAGQAKKIYVVGAFTGWDINSNKFALRETEEGSDVYTGTFTIAAGNFNFRFYRSLGDWETGSIGSQEPDAPLAISVTSAGTTVPAVNGKGNWQDEGWAGGDCSVSLDLNTMQVTFVKL